MSKQRDIKIIQNSVEEKIATASKRLSAKQKLLVKNGIKPLLKACSGRDLRFVALIVEDYDHKTKKLRNGRKRKEKSVRRAFQLSIKGVSIAFGDLKLHPKADILLILVGESLKVPWQVTLLVHLAMAAPSVAVTKDPVAAKIVKEVFQHQCRYIPEDHHPAGKCFIPYRTLVKKVTDGQTLITRVDNSLDHLHSTKKVIEPFVIGSDKRYRIHSRLRKYKK